MCSVAIAEGGVCLAVCLWSWWISYDMSELYPPLNCDRTQNPLRTLWRLWWWWW